MARLKKIIVTSSSKAKQKQQTITDDDNMIPSSSSSSSAASEQQPAAMEISSVTNNSNDSNNNIDNNDTALMMMMSDTTNTESTGTNTTNSSNSNTTSSNQEGMKEKENDDDNNNSIINNNNNDPNTKDMFVVDNMITSNNYTNNNDNDDDYNSNNHNDHDNSNNDNIMNDSMIDHIPLDTAGLLLLDDDVSSTRTSTSSSLTDTNIQGVENSNNNQQQNQHQHRTSTSNNNGSSLLFPSLPLKKNLSYQFLNSLVQVAQVETETETDNTVSMKKSTKFSSNTSTVTATATGTIKGARSSTTTATNNTVISTHTTSTMRGNYMTAAKTNECTAINNSGPTVHISSLSLQQQQQQQLKHTGSSISTTGTTTTTGTTSTGTGLPVYLRIRPTTVSSSAYNNDSNNTTFNMVEILGKKNTNQQQQDTVTTIRTIAPITSNTYKFAQRVNATTGSTTTIAKEYDFTNVFNETCTQQHVYEQTVQPIVQELIQTITNTTTLPNTNNDRHSALIFCYGITNAGKTHTVTGPDKCFQQNTTTSTSTGVSGSISTNNNKNWGLVPRTLQNLLTIAAEQQQQEKQSVFEIQLSYCEIYNEQIIDLLPGVSTISTTNTTTSSSINIDCSTGIRGLQKHTIKSIHDGIALLGIAQKNRHSGTNTLNDVSSRSHVICQFHINCTSTSTSSTNAKRSTSADLWIVDLAGNERSKRTAGNLRPKHETADINKSLMTLNRCLTTLRLQQQQLQLQTLKQQQSNNNSATSTSTVVIPYRDSKLTQIFGHHLTSTVSVHRTVMIVNVNPCIDDYDETQHVLNYACAARNVQLVSKSDTNNTKPVTSTAIGPVQYGLDGRRIYNTNTTILNEKKVKNGTTVPNLKSSASDLLLMNNYNNNRKRKGAHGTITTGDTIANSTGSTAQDDKVATNALGLGESKRLRISPVDDAIVNSDNNKACTGTSTTNTGSISKEVQRLRMELSVANAEKYTLQKEVNVLVERLKTIEETIETEIRYEASIEIDSIINQYEQIIQNYKIKYETSKNTTAKKHPQTSICILEKIHDQQQDQDQVQNSSFNDDNIKNDKNNSTGRNSIDSTSSNSSEATVNTNARTGTCTGSRDNTTSGNGSLIQVHHHSNTSTLPLSPSPLLPSSSSNVQHVPVPVLAPVETTVFQTHTDNDTQVPVHVPVMTSLAITADNDVPQVVPVEIESAIIQQQQRKDLPIDTDTGAENVVPVPVVTSNGENTVPVQVEEPVKTTIEHIVQSVTKSDKSNNIENLRRSTRRVNGSSVQYQSSPVPPPLPPQILLSSSSSKSSNCLQQVLPIVQDPTTKTEKLPRRSTRPRRAFGSLTNCF